MDENNYSICASWLSPQDSSDWSMLGKKSEEIFNGKGSFFRGRLEQAIEVARKHSDGLGSNPFPEWVYGIVQVNDGVLSDYIQRYSNKSGSFDNFE
ncbi:MAG: hypothetical protein PF569_03085 [Candidatus Woesearchaeota archaeon]|jgi:hypothetical protein|nr:hypothetical protein [Candidatus Woesearchaeota archaeon]